MFSSVQQSRSEEQSMTWQVWLVHTYSTSLRTREAKRIFSFPRITCQLCGTAAQAQGNGLL